MATFEKVAQTAQIKPRKLSYEPGLDGLRAVALLSIFMVHANIGWAPGGFLAVSTFFTLSGFLIMALLVREREARGGIDLAAFWQRRARRLLPASLLAILGIAVATFFLGDARQIDLIVGDVVSALAYVANWRFIVQETTYAGEFGGQSPLLHFWSLAIEEQFYLLFPLIIVGAMSMASNWRRSVGLVLLLGTTVSLIMGVVTSLGDATPDRLYFRTDIRAGELLVGALFGLWWMGPGREMSESFHRAIRAVGLLLLVAMVALIATSDYRDLFWYRGGLIAYSLLTVGVILACVESKGTVRRVLSWPPLVQVGVVSYGAYLVHWPMFMWLYTETSLSGFTRLVGGTAACLVLAGLSHRLLERPIREKKFKANRTVINVGVGMAVLAVVAAYAAREFAEPREGGLDQAVEALESEQASQLVATGELPAVGMFGDSTALVVALGLAQAKDEPLKIEPARGWADLGCTPSAPAHFINKGREVRSNKRCDDWLDGWRAVSDAGQLDAAVVQFGPWEVRDTRPFGWESFSVIGEDARRDDYIARRIREGLDALASTPLIIIMTSPRVEPGRVNGRPPARQQPSGDVARMDRLNEIILEVAGEYSNVAVIDLAGWIDASENDDVLRPDGVHFSREAARAVAPRLAATFAAVVDVFHGGPKPENTAEIISVLRYIEPGRAE